MSILPTAQAEPVRCAQAEADQEQNGGLSEYVALDYRMVHPLPDALPDEWAPFIEPLSCALHAYRQAQVEVGDTAVVFGAGTMGLLTAMAALPAAVILVEPDDVRRAQAEDILQTKALATGRTRECHSTRPACAQRSIAAATHKLSHRPVGNLAKGGRLVLAGLVGNTEGTSIPLADVTRKELSIVGAWLNPNTFAAAIEIAAAQQDQLSSFSTRTFPLTEVVQAFAVAAEHIVHKVTRHPLTAAGLSPCNRNSGAGLPGAESRVRSGSEKTAAILAWSVVHGVGMSSETQIVWRNAGGRLTDDPVCVPHASNGYFLFSRSGPATS